MHHVDGLAQDCSDTSAFAMELLQYVLCQTIDVHRCQVVLAGS